MNDKINVEMFINLHSFYKNYVALIFGKVNNYAIASKIFTYFILH